MRKYIEVCKFSLKTEFNFRANYIFTIFSFVIHIFVFNELWDFILKDENILEYSRPELIWYIIIGEFLIYVVNGKNYKKIADMIKSGDVANLLIKPISFLKYCIAQEMSCFFNFIINWVSAIILGILIAGKLEVTLLQILFFFISVIFSVILLILIQVMIGMLAFLTEENDAYYLVISKAMMLVVFTPLEFFPNIVQNIFKMLPTTYAIYPAGKILVHFQYLEALKLIGFQMLSIIFIIGIVNLLNKKGVKNISVNGG